MLGMYIVDIAKKTGGLLVESFLPATNMVDILPEKRGKD
jgi:hypothetical protein